VYPSSLQKKLNRLLPCIITALRVLPRKDSNGGWPIRVRMLFVDTEASTFILLANETCTVFLKNLLLSAGRTVDQNSPCSRVRSEPPARQVSNASFRQESSGYFFTNYSSERHDGIDSLHRSVAAHRREKHPHHFYDGRAKYHNEHAREDKENERQ
jgi:hypothetical protein